MQVAVLVDILILSPVMAFLLWLYWYTAPAGRSMRLRMMDVGLAATACLLSGAVFIGLHGWLDIEGMDRSIIVVAASYLTFIAAMGAIWLVRWYLHASQARPVNDGPVRDN